MKQPIPCAYLINLEAAIDRWERSKSQLEAAGIPFQRIEAIRGADLTFPHPSFDEQGYRLRQGRRRIDAEVGCYLSHLSAIQHFYDSGDEYGIIMEDDIELADGFLLLIEKSIQKGGFDMLRLSTVNSGRWTKTYPLDETYFMGVAYSREKGAGAYLINRKAAQRMLKNYLPMKLAYDLRFDMEWLDGFRTLGITPSPVLQKGFKSQIQIKIRNAYLSKYTRYWTVFPYRSVCEITRIISRLSTRIAWKP